MARGAESEVPQRAASLGRLTKAQEPRRARRISAAEPLHSLVFDQKIPFACADLVRAAFGLGWPWRWTLFIQRSNPTKAAS